MSSPDDDDGAPPSGLRVTAFAAGASEPKSWDDSLLPKAADPATVEKAMGLDPGTLSRAPAQAGPEPAFGGSTTIPVMDASEARTIRLKCLDIATKFGGTSDFGALMARTRQLIGFVMDGA